VFLSSVLQTSIKEYEGVNLIHSIISWQWCDYWYCQWRLIASNCHTKNEIVKILGRGESEKSKSAHKFTATAKYIEAAGGEAVIM
jgi:hypothetical protein